MKQFSGKSLRTSQSVVQDHRSPTEDPSNLLSLCFKPLSSICRILTPLQPEHMPKHGSPDRTSDPLLLFPSTASCLFCLESRQVSLTLHLTATQSMSRTRKYDNENYLATLLITKPKVRQTAFSLRAFNVELAQVLDSTSSAATASARFAFWSDVVEHIFSPDANQRYDGNPVVRELKTVRLIR